MLQFYVHATMMADPSIQPPYTRTITTTLHNDHQRQHLTHQHHHTTMTVWLTNSTSPHNYYPDHQPRRPHHNRHNHSRRLQQLAMSLRRLESATAASNGQVANGTQVELTTAAVRPQLPHATINCKSSFFLFCLCFYIDFTYTNSIQINYLTTNWQWQLAAGTATATGCQQQQEQR